MSKGDNRQRVFGVLIRASPWEALEQLVLTAAWGDEEKQERRKQQLGAKTGYQTGRAQPRRASPWKALGMLDEALAKSQNPEGFPPWG